MTRQANSQGASARPTRTPIGKKDFLRIRNKEDGYHYRIVNANLERDPERVQNFLDAGYEIVPAKETGQVGDSRVGSPSALGSASSVSVGLGTKAVVMRIREDWYKEDQAEKMKSIDEVEATMHRDGRSDYGDLSISDRKR